MIKLSPEYDLKFGNITKDGHTMFLEDVVKDIIALQRKHHQLKQTVERLREVLEHYADGYGGRYSTGHQLAVDVLKETEAQP
jgi:hypothetical protein